MSTKVIVCRCEDVTLADVEHALAGGYRSVEELKRYTGLGTGPCQGKECMVHAAHLCAAAGLPHPAPFTSRPPLGAVSFAALARGDEEP
jgi:sarcosine oxidase subunit beta